MADRYFSSQPVSAENVILEGDEARHLARVMRAQPGDAAIVFDGSGAEFTCEVTDVQRHSVKLIVRERREVDREAPIRVTLAVSLPKGDRQRWLVEKLTELGAARLQPLRSERSVAQPSENALGRLRRAVIEATKQCRRNQLLEILPAADWPEFVSADDVARSTREDSALRLVADPSGSQSFAAAIDCSGAAAHRQSLYLAVGPEGGFSERELALAAEHGWQIVNFGSRILRVETAAVAAMANIALQASAGQ